MLLNKLSDLSIHCSDAEILDKDKDGMEIFTRMDELNDSPLHLLRTFSSLCEAGHMDAALAAVSRLITADRRDVLLRSVT